MRKGGEPPANREVTKEAKVRLKGPFILLLTSLLALIEHKSVVAVRLQIVNILAFIHTVQALKTFS